MSEVKDKKRKKSKSTPEEGKGEASSSSKKSRKSSSKASGNDERGDRVGSDGSKVTLRAPEKRQAYEIGAVLVGTADFTPPKDVAFTLHHQPSSSSSAASSSSSQPARPATLEESLLLSGETDTMNMVAYNWDLDGGVGHDESSRRDAKGYSGEYLIGVYDPSTQSVTLRVAPMFVLRRSIKALESLSLNASNVLGDYEQRIIARRGLGEAFGNRKTKAKARAEDRMKVDTTNMLDVMDTLQDDIGASNVHAKSLNAIQSEAEQARPIPPLNTEALTPQEAYPLHVLIPDAVFQLLSTRRLEKVESKEALGKALPIRPGQSSWLKDRMWSIIQSVQLGKSNGNMGEGVKIDFDEDGSQQTASSTTGILKSSKQDARIKLKVALYIALLWSFVTLVGKGNHRSGGDKESLLAKLRLDQVTAGEQVLDDLFARFCEVQRGVKRGVMSNFTEAKVYAYMFALCLHLDNFSIDPAPLARDLALPPTKVADIFRSLGCSPTMKPVQGVNGASTKQRRIILKCPVELPKPRRGRRT